MVAALREVTAAYQLVTSTRKDPGSLQDQVKL